MSTKFKELPKQSDAKKAIIIGSLVDHFLDQDTTNIGADNEARNVALALKVVDQPLALVALTEEYYKFYPKLDKLKIHFSNQQRDSEL